MKVEKWYAKATDILERSSNAIYANDEAKGCAYFTIDGYVAYQIPGCIYSARNSSAENAEQKKNGVKKLFASCDGSIATKTDGRFINQYGKYSKKVTKLVNETGSLAFVQSRFVRQFPANTSYYISGPTSPVYAGIWENGIINIIAVIMPVHPLGRRFEEE